MRIRTIPSFAAGAAVVLALSSCGSSGSGGSGSADIDDPELQELVTAAQEEGSLTLYGVPDESLLRGVADEFAELYGVQIEPVRLVSADLSQRFSSEADSGQPASDAILLTHSPFYAEALEKEWLTPLTEAGVPDYPDEYPEDYVVEDGDVPLVSLVPTSMVYNTDEVSSEPDSWEDYADPEHKGKLAIADPATSPANLAFWQIMRDEYGDEFLESVAENNPTWHNSAVPGTQAVAAGESTLGHPGVQAIVDNLKEEDAPVEATVPGPTTGPEIALGLTADAQNPNAAKLFAHYILSEEGSTHLAEISNAASPYGLGLDDFQRPEPVSDEQEAEIEELLGAE
ncbi:iron(III) transport system substrate-binding protein [Lipingzhangella halophila]|uniref:Iron(III) transport system substrate-binding protein n=1 Tax=Lipingzhangella halophila TaxID=1783352 RepID=A0A7W7RIJ9_9ACTN|nr:extracellular solute-binding protein [Lipingzhangella halophila]MBB4932643.1 iron(III) transport system substrate-binding protein [Lipingzhangella halophila]